MLNTHGTAVFMSADCDQAGDNDIDSDAETAEDAATHLAATTIVAMATGGVSHTPRSSAPLLPHCDFALVRRHVHRDHLVHCITHAHLADAVALLTGGGDTMKHALDDLVAVGQQLDATGHAAAHARFCVALRQHLVHTVRLTAHTRASLALLVALGEVESVVRATQHAQFDARMRRVHLLPLVGSVIDALVDKLLAVVGAATVVASPHTVAAVGAAAPAACVHAAPLLSLQPAATVTTTSTLSTTATATTTSAATSLGDTPRSAPDLSSLTAVTRNALTAFGACVSILLGVLQGMLPSPAALTSSTHRHRAAATTALIHHHHTHMCALAVACDLALDNARGALSTSLHHALPFTVSSVAAVQSACDRVFVRACVTAAPHAVADAADAADPVMQFANEFARVRTATVAATTTPTLSVLPTAAAALLKRRALVWTALFMAHAFNQYAAPLASGAWTSPPIEHLHTLLALHGAEPVLQILTSNAAVTPATLAAIGDALDAAIDEHAPLASVCDSMTSPDVAASASLSSSSSAAAAALSASAVALDSRRLALLERWCALAPTASRYRRVLAVCARLPTTHAQLGAFGDRIATSVLQRHLAVTTASSVVAAESTSTSAASTIGSPLSVDNVQVLLLSGHSALAIDQLATGALEEYVSSCAYALAVLRYALETPAGVDKAQLARLVPFLRTIVTRHQHVAECRDMGALLAHLPAPLAALVFHPLCTASLRHTVDASTVAAASTGVRTRSSTSLPTSSSPGVHAPDLHTLGAWCALVVQQLVGSDDAAHRDEGTRFVALLSAAAALEPRLSFVDEASGTGAAAEEPDVDDCTAA